MIPRYKRRIVPSRNIINNGTLWESGNLKLKIVIVAGLKYRTEKISIRGKCFDGGRHHYKSFSVEQRTKHLGLLYFTLLKTSLRFLLFYNLKCGYVWRTFDERRTYLTSVTVTRPLCKSSNDNLRNFLFHFLIFAFFSRTRCFSFLKLCGKIFSLMNVRRRCSRF